MTTPTPNDPAQKAAEEINDIVDELIFDSTGVKPLAVASGRRMKRFTAIIRTALEPVEEKK